MKRAPAHRQPLHGFCAEDSVHVVRFAAQVPQAERTTQTQPVDQPLTLTAGGQAESAPAHARVFYPARLMALALLALLLAEWGMYHREKY